MNKKIKSATITQNEFIIRDVTDEELDIRGHLSQFTEYDRDGRTLKEIKYDRMGIFEDMHLYTYDEKGMPVTESYFQQEHEEAEKTTFEHDGSGHLMKSRKKYLDDSVDTTTYYYDENKRLVKKVITSDDDEPEEVELFEVEETHTAEEVQDEDDNNVQLTRNEKGKIILEEVFSADDELLTRVERKYDSEDNLSEVEVFIDGQGKTFTRHYILRYDYTFFEE